eukprot:6473348-Amphidinium_carterae.1
MFAQSGEVMDRSVREPTKFSYAPSVDPPSFPRGQWSMTFRKSPVLQDDLLVALLGKVASPGCQSLLHACSSAWSGVSA